VGWRVKRAMTGIFKSRAGAYIHQLVFSLIFLIIEETPAFSIEN
jgi:hypothetical protein